MKTNRFIIAALFAAAAVSCQKESFEGSENPRETESATIVAGEMTKTSLNGSEVHWTSDDVIAVFDNNNYKNQFNITDVQGSSASFRGTVTTGTTQIYAVYPHNLAVSASGSTISVTIPVDQTSKVGSFAEEHNISVAKGVKTPGVEAIRNITFRNVGSYLKFTIPSYIEDAKSVTFSTSRAIAGAATVDASAETPVAVVGEGGSSSITMTGSYPAGSQFMFVLSSGEIQGFTVTVVTGKATWSITRNTVVTFAPGQYRNLGTLELEQVTASASAAHTYSGNTLTGTTVNVALNVPAATQQYASDLELVVKNAAGTVVRSVSKSTLSASEALAANTDWPYLPQGTYTVSGSYKLGETVRTISANFTSPAPTFAVTSGAYSSYTKYAAGNASVANSCNAETIYNVTSANVSIADAILNNSNYSSLKSGFTYKLDGSATTSATVGGQSWGAHTVTASYTFDGVAKEGSSDCHITGLPYTLNVSGNDSVSAWATEGNVAWANTDRGSAVRVGYALGSNFNTGESYMTKTFNLPQNVNVSVTATGEARGSRFIVTISTTASVKVSGTTLHTATAKGKDTYTSFSGTKTATMTSASPTVQLHNSNSTNEACTYFKSLYVGYGNK
ncbi:MAG: hypothetical protein E7111_05720 [Bacteroidales bacterium]|nr:hypothetical protein [Bacteroidales bacterium]